MDCQFLLGPQHIVNAILCPLVDWVLALATLFGEVGEPLLEGKPEDFYVYIVRELLSNYEQLVTEDECRKEIDYVSTARAQRHRQLIEEDEESNRCKHVELHCAQLLEDYVQDTDMKREMHVITHTVGCRQRVEASVLPQKALCRVAILEQCLQETKRGRSC